MAELDYDVLVGEVGDVVEEIYRVMKHVYSELDRLRELYDMLSVLVEEEYLHPRDVDSILVEIDIAGREGASRASEVRDLIRMISVKLARRRVRRVEREEEGEEASEETVD